MYFEDFWWRFALLAIGAYFIGCISFARLISKFNKKDITKEGSGNPGTLNMSRTFGLKIGILTLILDISKGVIPALIGKFAFSNVYFASSELPVSEFATYFAGFFAVLGHIFPVVYKFKGGKGIATTIGVFLVGEFPVTAIFAVLAIAYILITAMGSMGSFIVTVPPAIAALLDFYKLFREENVVGDSIMYFVVAELLIIGIIMLTWYAHRQNIRRLLAGEEHETGWLDMIHEKYMKKKAAKLAKKSKAEEEKLKSEKENPKSEQDRINDEQGQLKSVKIDDKTDKAAPESNYSDIETTEDDDKNIKDKNIDIKAVENSEGEV